MLKRYIVFILTFVICDAAFAQMGNGSERAAERRVGKQIEAQVEKQVGRGVDKQLDKQLEKQIEKGVGKAVSQQVEKLVGGPSIESKVENQGLSRAKTVVSATPAAARSAIVQDERRIAAEAQQGRVASVASNKAASHYNIAVDVNGSMYIEDQNLLLATEQNLNELKRLGIVPNQITKLKGLEQYLIEFDNGQAARLEGAIANSNSVNYLYQYQAGDALLSTDSWMPQEAMPLAAVHSGNGLRVGLIDSKPDLAHKSFTSARVTTRSFVAANLVEPHEHGTAIGSILVGGTKNFTGLLPKAELYSASVFYESKAGDVASLKSIVMAIDWLILNRVKVINMSLAGPPNSLLEMAVNKAQKLDMAVVAAAGNGGPAARPAYPAGYEGVIAVTAVDRNLQVYYRANRGMYIDFSAPGVNIIHVKAGGETTVSSGTSYAVPFVVAALAVLNENLSLPQSLIQLSKSAKDLGDPNKDRIFGVGLVSIEP